jgi:hypothetical protein
MLHQSKMETATRLGFAARALMYMLLGWMALRTGHGETGTEVLDHLKDGGGIILMGLMAIGFFGYGVWRLSEAIMDSEGHGQDAKGLVVRTGGCISGLVHLGLGLYAAKLALGDSGGGGGAAQSGASTALTLPGGTVLLSIAAAALVATGLYQVVKAVRADFLQYLLPRAARAPWVRWVGFAGYAARGLVFAIMGWTLWRAAQEENGSRAADMGTALDVLSGPVLLVVAAGLLLFGIFSAVEAIYRRINSPEVVGDLRSRIGLA